MLNTLKEAVECWCPFARVAIEQKLPSAFNRVLQIDGVHGGPKAANCIASDCMAWRWADAPPGPRVIDAIAWGVWDKMTIEQQEAEIAAGQSDREPHDVPPTWTWEAGVTSDFGDDRHPPRWTPHGTSVPPAERPFHGCRARVR